MSQMLADGPVEDSQKVKYESLAWGKIFLWGWRLISFARWRFFVSVVVALLSTLFVMYNAIIIGQIGQKLEMYRAPVKRVVVSSAAVNSLSYIGKVVSDKVHSRKTSSFFQKLVPESLMGMVWTFFAVVLLILFFRFFSQWYTTRVDALINRKLQKMLHDKMLTLGPVFHQKNDLGKKSAIMHQFSSGMQMMLCELYRTLLVEMVTFVSATFLLLKSLSGLNAPAEWSFFLIVLLIIIPIVGRRLARLLQKTSHALRDGMIGVQSEFLNSGTSPVEVQLMRATPQRTKAFDRKLATHEGAKIKAALYSAINNVFSTSAAPFIQALFLIIVLGGLGSEVNNIGKIAGLVITFIMIVPKALNPVQMAVGFFTGMNTNWPQVKTVIDLLEQEPEMKEQSDASPLKVSKGELRLDGVSFAYSEGDRYIIKNVSHTFDTGKVTAISAQIGAGKSTILGLIMRLYDPQIGSIYVDNLDIKSVTLSSLREQIVRVSQFPLFVTDTVRENFLLAKGDASDEEIEAVCRMTHFWENTLLKKLKEGSVKNPLDLMFAREPGHDWTGGERRVMALTRALLCRPAVLLIDEPTTGVDAITSKEIAKVVRCDAFRDMTIVLVDHNPKFLTQVADTVICLEDAEFTDIGTPQELLRSNTLFKKLSDSFH